MQYEDFIERHLEVVSRAGDEWMAFCIAHDNHNSPAFRINVESGLFICYSCGFSGHIDKLRDFLGVNDELSSADSELKNLVKQLDSIDEAEGSEEEYKVSESLLTRYDNQTDYWYSRGFDDSTIKKFQLGQDVMARYVTIPFRNYNGDLLGVIKRYLAHDSLLKYKYPRKFKKSSEMFGSWLVYKSDNIRAVTLVEGSIDAIKLWQAGIPALAIYGSSLSARQRLLLDYLDIRKVTLFFDNDEAGHKAKKAALGIENKTVKRDGRYVKADIYEPKNDLRTMMNVNVVEYQPGMANDPGDICSADLNWMVNNAKRL